MNLLHHRRHWIFLLLWLRTSSLDSSSVFGFSMYPGRKLHPTNVNQFIISLHESAVSRDAAVVVTEEEIIHATTIMSDSPVLPSVTQQPSRTTSTRKNDFVSFSSFLLACFAAAMLLLAWEDVTCSYVVPSRHRIYTASNKQGFAQSTIHGLGFNAKDRLELDYLDVATQDLKSYNEVMASHRLERVPRWKATAATASAMNKGTAPSSNHAADISTIQEAIHTLLDCVASVHRLQDLAQNYDWDQIQVLLHSEPLATQLEQAASLVRVSATIDSDASTTIGFDWGSCAWRHCGALADAQEALDELESLLNVLEPPEALFCLDVAERSLRDVLVSVNWKLANEQDRLAWKKLAAEYKPYQSQRNNNEGGLDDEYLKAIQDLRID